MGTVSSLLCLTDDPGAFRAGAREVEDSLRSADHRFSPYRRDSELNLLRRGILDERNASPEMTRVLAGCRLVATLTDGAFQPRTPSGHWDTTGFAKGWAIARAGERLRALGLADWVLSVGGDLACSGRNGHRPWHVAVRDPRHPLRVSRILAVTDAAVATSGDYERGPHVWDGKTMRRRHGSCTVVGPRIELADALATACWARGPERVGFLHRLPEYEVIFLD